MSKLAIRMHPTDNVAIARRKLEAGESAYDVELPGEVPTSHKFALRKIKAGEEVVRYGQPIGKAKADIAAGQHIHTHNLAFDYTGRDYEFATENPQPPSAPEGFETFQGFERSDGRVGTRNYLAVVSSVNCSGHVPGLVVDRCRDLLKQFPNVDGILPISHQTGCGITMGNQAHESLKRTFSGLMNHPNIVGAVLVGLGCEQLDPSSLVKGNAANDGLVQLRDLTKQGERGDPLPMADEGSLLVSIQSHGGTESTVNEIGKYLERLLPRANAAKRVAISTNRLVLAENCGGSDALSGVTANPALGVAADLLVALGATVVLAETPETAGAEHLLTKRARTKEVGEKLVALIRWWEEYFRIYERLLTPPPSLDNNPSKGNKAGGLTTIVEKSLGAVAKAGLTRLNHVLAYAEPIPQRAGLCFMDTPGKDSASMTGLVAGGANIGVFTTGRGNVAGWAPAPTIKICTNTPTYNRLTGDMDLNAGVILDGTATIAEVGMIILRKIIDVASGERTRNELLGANTSCIDPWYFGPTV